MIDVNAHGIEEVVEPTDDGAVLAENGIGTDEIGGGGPRRKADFYAPSADGGMVKLNGMMFSARPRRAARFPLQGSGCAVWLVRRATAWVEPRAGWQPIKEAEMGVKW